VKNEGSLLKITVFSDSHRYKQAMFDAVNLESPDVILHLGDNDRDCSALALEFPQIPIRSVKGNCDSFSTGKDVDQFMLGGKLFFITHGHLHGVKSGLASITKAAIEQEADILLFGHTHIPHKSVLENLIIINPGSIGILEKTYAVLETRNGVISCEIKSI